MDIQYCVNHNEPIIFFDANISDPNLRSLCRLCISSKTSNLKIVEQETDEKQKAFDELKSESQTKIQILQNVINCLNQYQKRINLTLDKFVSSLMQQKVIIEQFSNQLSSKQNIDDCQSSIDNQDQLIQKLVTQQLQNLEQSIKIDQIKDSCKEIDSSQIEINQKFKTFSYKLLNKGGKKQTERCWAIAFNQDASLIFYGCDKLIKINKFENGRISNQIQELNGHNNFVACLDYMENSHELVSAGSDNYIIIWGRNEQGQWTLKQKLQEHNFSINCLILNQKEALLISGSADFAIKFWSRKKQIWICQQTIQTKVSVLGLSLDEKAKTLIAYGYDVPEILVISKEKNEWKLKQTIKVKEYGSGLCFIDSNMFAHQPNNFGQLEIYEFDKQSKLFTKIKEIQVKNLKGISSLLLCQYIQFREILFVKNNTYINIIRRQESGEFITQQSIDFKSGSLFGRATKDGLFLAIWDGENKEISIRKLEYSK